MNSEFEKQLQRQPPRELPREWRAQILDAAFRPAPLSMAAWLASWLWPHPRAWGGLAAAWVVILLLHFTSPDDLRVADNYPPATFQSLAIMKQQTLRMAQLLGSTDNSDQPAATPAPPKPRSERSRQQIAA
jgi:hypothetical protein